MSDEALDAKLAAEARKIGHPYRPPPTLEEIGTGRRSFDPPPVGLEDLVAEMSGQDHG